MPARLLRASALLAPDVGVQVGLVTDHLAACGALSSPAMGLPLVGGELLLLGWCALLLRAPKFGLFDN